MATKILPLIDMMTIIVLMPVTTLKYSMSKKYESPVLRDCPMQLPIGEMKFDVGSYLKNEKIYILLFAIFARPIYGLVCNHHCLMVSLIWPYEASHHAAVANHAATLDRYHVGSN